MQLNLESRAEMATHPISKKLLQIMQEKKSNLCLACDVTKKDALLKWADAIGPYISVLKTHIDILDDFTFDVVARLKSLSIKHQFLIFEDRKFADIGQTVSKQLSGGIYRIAEWADLINAHIVPGPGIIDGLKEGANGQGLLLLAEMSSSGTMAHGDYTAQAKEMGEARSDFVCGFISLRKLSNQPGLIHFTPGIKLEKGIDSLGQQYRSLDDILKKNQSDIVIVGRDIMTATDPVAKAALYREKAWGTYLSKDFR